jgi:hypothetical protein
MTNLPGKKLNREGKQNAKDFKVKEKITEILCGVIILA